MVSRIKKFGLMFLWMGIVAGSIITLSAFFNFPDEVAGVLYFIGIGIAASSVLNYYRKEENS